MTTITALNVRLGMDVSNFSEGANLAKNEVTKVATIMRQSVPPAEKYKQELDLLNRAFSDAGKKSAEYANAVDFLAKKHQQGKYSAEEAAKAQAEIARANEAAAAAAKQQKEELARLAEVERQRQSVLEKGKQLTQSLQTAEEAYWKRFVEFRELRKSGAITEETYARALEQSRKTLVAAQASTDTAIAAAKKLKEEKARLAEEERRHQAVMDKGRSLTQSVEKVQEAHNRRVREYRELLRAGAIDQETFRRAVERSAKTQQQATTSSNQLLSSIKGMAAAYLGFQTVTKSLNLASQVEDATIAFEVLTGSAAEGQLLFEQIRKFAAESPVTFGNATQAAKTMLSFGVAVQDVQKNLRMLSDVTGGNNERFTMLALAFSQTSAAGRLMGQDLLQMINAGFNPLQQISKDTGESLIDLKKRMEDGGISAEEVRKAFENATAAGGMFDGMTARLAQTLSGQINIAMSELEKKMADFGAKLGPLVTQLLGLFESLQPWLEATVTLLGRVADGLGYMFARATDLKNSITTFSWDETETNKFLDRLEQRERDLANYKRQAALTEFRQKNNAVNQIAAAEKKAAEEKAAADKKAVEEQEKARLQLVEDERKKRERAEQQAEQQFQRDLENARQAAMDFFAEQEQKQRKQRSDVAAGPGSGMELGSAEAARFSADRINNAIGIAAAPVSATPGELQIAMKAEEMFKEQKLTNAAAREHNRLLGELLQASRENGFARIR